MQDADFDRVLGLGGQCRGKAECQSRRGGKQAAGERSLGDRAEGCMHRDVLLFDGQQTADAVRQARNRKRRAKPARGVSYCENKVICVILLVPGAEREGL